MEQTTKTGRTTTIDAYVATFPVDIQERLATLRQAIREEAPDATEAIAYRMPTFVLHGNLVHFAAWRRHIALYPVTAAMEAAIPELKDFKTSGRGTIQFPHDRPLPVTLIRRIVAMRVAENRATAAAQTSP